MITFTTTQRKYTLSIRPSSIYLFFFNLCPLWDAAVSGLCTFLFKHIHTYTYIHNDRCAKVIDGSRKGVEAGLCCCDSVWVSSLVSQMICQLYCVGVFVLLNAALLGPEYISTEHNDDNVGLNWGGFGLLYPWKKCNLFLVTKSIFKDNLQSTFSGCHCAVIILSVLISSSH